jgi:hypothetical protein
MSSAKPLEHTMKFHPFSREVYPDSLSPHLHPLAEEYNLAIRDSLCLRMSERLPRYDTIKEAYANIKTLRDELIKHEFSAPPKKGN